MAVLKKELIDKSGHGNERVSQTYLEQRAQQLQEGFHNMVRQYQKEV